MLQQLNTKGARKVPAQNGWHWINEGVRYFISNKLIWMLSMFFILFLSVLLINIIPGAQLILLFVYPFIAAGLSQACAGIEKGNKMTFKFIFMAFSNPNRLNLFRYGLLVLLLVIIAQMLATIILGVMGVDFELITTELNAIKDNQEASLQLIFTSPVLLRFFVVTIISMLPIVMINLMAPILLAFSALTAWESVKLSFVAGIKNFTAFALYGAIYMLLFFIVFIVLNWMMQLLFYMFGQNSLLAIYLYLFLFVMIVLAIVSVSYSSAYVAFKDLFLGEEI